MGQHPKQDVDAVEDEGLPTGLLPMSCTLEYEISGLCQDTDSSIMTSRLRFPLAVASYIALTSARDPAYAGM